MPIFAAEIDTIHSKILRHMETNRQVFKRKIYDKIPTSC